MTNAKSSARDLVAAAVLMGTGSGEQLGARGFYEMRCLDADRKPKWLSRSKNLVVNGGLKDMNDKYFTGVAYTAAWFVGLYGAAATNNPAAADTMAAHPGWVEVVPYSEATRPAVVFAPATLASPSIITNAASPAQYNINANGTIGGAFLVSNNVKSGATGILFSAADLQPPGDRIVAAGDIILLTYRFELSAL